MTKSKSSASCIVVSSILVTRLVNGAQFLNDNYVAGATATVTSLLTKLHTLL